MPSRSGSAQPPPNDVNPDGKLRLGVLGLGLAGSVMVSTIRRHPSVVIAAAADRNAAPRAAFARDFNAPAYDDAEALMADKTVDAIYVATPHQFHRDHSILAMRHGKHVIVEKPMALHLADCDAMIAAAQDAGVALVVGHSHSFDPNVVEIAKLVASGAFGPLAMVNMWNYNDFLYRPRRPEELDTAQGGGIAYNQLPHQIDTARLIANSRVRSVRAHTTRLDSARPTEGGSIVMLDFESGVAASLVYSGYDHFDSDEWHFGIGERGAPKSIAHGAARRALAKAEDETKARTETFAYGNTASALPPHQPHFGITIVTCADGDMRASADGVTIYGRDGVRDIAIPRGGSMPGRREVLDDLAAAIRTGRKPVHDGRWGKATVEVALAILRSSRENRDVMLEHQVAVDGSPR
jgi:phthalate 4,5-cis-dihydrodiol dehydrogenase